MADGPPFSDEERLVLVLIWKYHGYLPWPQATMVFNTVFKHQIRSETSLVSAWYGRDNNDQQEAWDRLRAEPHAGHDLATHMQWVQTIYTAVAQLGVNLYPAVQQPHINVNPAVGQLHRPKEKPQRTPRVQWDDEMRLV